jgi:hypothetical protein
MPSVWFRLIFFLAVVTQGPDRSVHKSNTGLPLCAGTLPQQEEDSLRPPKTATEESFKDNTFPVKAATPYLYKMILRAY